MDREAYLRGQVEAYPEDPFWPHTLGVWLMGQGRLTEAEAAFQEALRRNPTGRLTTPQDIAVTIRALCDPEIERINGAVIVVDGGERISM